MSSRSLSYGDVAYTAFAQKWIDPPSGPPYKSTSGWYAVNSDYYSHSGVNTPNFHKRLRAGELLPFTNWKQFTTKGECSAPTNELTYTKTGTRSWWEGDRPLLSPDEYFFTSSDLFDYLDEEDLTQEIQEYVQKSAASIAERGWDALTFLAELHKTVALFRRIVPRLIETIRRGRLDRAWLESRYGWRILLYDAEDIKDLIEAINDKQKESKFVKQRTGTNRSYIESTDLTYIGGSGTYHFTREDAWDISIRGNVVAAYAASLARFNLPATMWEITKFSFLIDWFIDVGQWLSAMTFLFLSSDYTAAGGIHATCERTVTYDFTEWNPFWTGDHEMSSTASAEFTLRIPTSVPLTPLWKIDLDWLKVTDLLALLFSILRKR